MDKDDNNESKLNLFDGALSKFMRGKDKMDKTCQLHDGLLEMY